MNLIKHKIMMNMTNEQKTMLLVKIPYINMFKLSSIYEKKINLIGGNLSELYKNTYNKEYNNETGKYNIKINGNQYYYNVERYSFFDNNGVEDKKYKYIDLITIKNTQEIKPHLISGAPQKIDNDFLGCKYKNNIHCGSIAIETKNNNASITSLGNDTKCLLSGDNKTEFKYGDILFQIMINICKKENVKKIVLTDNSYRQCGNTDLSLDYLKTLTHGFPHYHKYGFKYKYDHDNQILKENYKHFLTSPTINANKILSLLKEKKIDNKIINKIKKLFEIYKKENNNNEISVRKFVKFYTNDLKDIERCNFIKKIYIDLYTLTGYKPYLTKDYVLYL